MSARAIRTWLIVAGVLAVLAACSSTTPVPERSTTTEQPAEHGAFAHCLSEHGVTEPTGPAAGPAPGPVSAPAGVDQNTWHEAMQACSSLAPGPPGP